MGTNSKIEWTNHTMNYWVGCEKVSVGCKNCYAERNMKQFGRNFDELVRTKKSTWDQHKKWKAGERVFVNSWSDFFDSRVPTEWRSEAWELMESRPDLIWMILTKRDEIMHHYCVREKQNQIPAHIWLGVSLENMDYIDRVESLICVNAAIRFISVEPQLGPIDLSGYLTSERYEDNSRDEYGQHIDWVICGGESGPDRRLMPFNYAMGLHAQCVRAGVPLFFKQWDFDDGKGLIHMPTIDGKVYNELPERTI